MALHESITPQPESEPLLADINSAAQEALQTVASDRNIDPDIIHFQLVCSPVTDFMIPALRAKGYSLPNNRGERHIARVGWLYDETGKPLPIDQQPDKSAVIHYFPVIETDGTPENEIIADATWQQFLTPEQRTAELPKVLAGTRQQVRAQLQSYGFTDENLLRIWEKPEAPNKPRPRIG